MEEGEGLEAPQKSLFYVVVHFDWLNEWMNENLYLYCIMNQLKLKVTAGINSCAVNKTLQLLYNIQYDYERVNKEYELYNYIYNYVDYKWKRSFLKELREVSSLICLGSLGSKGTEKYFDP